MAVCENCGKRYNVKGAKARFHEHYFARGDDDMWYDDYVSSDLCADCAIEETNEGMGTYSHMAEYFDDDD